MARGFSSHVALTSYGRECNLHSGFEYRSLDEWDCYRIWGPFIDGIGWRFYESCIYVFFILLLLDNSFIYRFETRIKKMNLLSFS